MDAARVLPVRADRVRHRARVRGQARPEGRGLRPGTLIRRSASAPRPDGERDAHAVRHFHRPTEDRDRLDAIVRLPEVERSRRAEAVALGTDRRHRNARPGHAVERSSPATRTCRTPFRVESSRTEVLRKTMRG